MATTSQLLTWIESVKHGWTREGVKGTRPLLNEAHKMLLYDEIEQRLVLEDGDFPFLVTTDSVYQYNLPVACSVLTAVVVDAEETIDSDFHIEDYRNNGKHYYRILDVNSREATNDDAAILNFIGVNPGDTTELYRLVYYEAPINIASDVIQHQMPGSCDMEFLMPATIKLIEGIDHGNIIEARQYIYEVIKPQFKARMSRSDQGVPTFCRKRRF